MDDEFVWIWRLMLFLYAILCIWIFKNFQLREKPIKDWITENDRGIRMFAFCIFVIILVVLVLLSMGSSSVGNLIHPGTDIKRIKEISAPFAGHTIKDIKILDFNLDRWKSHTQAFVVLAGIPIAYMLWHWRDKNVRDQIQNQRDDTRLRDQNERKDILLKEFLEVQLRAAGALDKDIEVGRETLQIASLHQLRIFLGRENPGIFQRPAFELLLAGHATEMDDMGTGQLAAIPSVRRATQPQFAVSDPQTFFEKLKGNRVARERMGIFREEVDILFNSKVPLNGRNFDLLDLVIPMVENGIDVSRSSFFGTNLQNSNLSGMNFTNCRLQGADLRGTNWRDVQSFQNAYFDQFTQLNDSPEMPWARETKTSQLALRNELKAMGAIFRQRRKKLPKDN